MVPYYDAFLTSRPRPQFTWTLEPDGSVTVATIDAPKAVNLWQASNSVTRDFRLVTIGAAWTATPLFDQGGGIYIADAPEPNEGWTAFFVELVYESTFQNPGEYDYRFTTEMRVLPESRPFEGDFDRDRLTDANDLVILSDLWLMDNDYRDISPRRTGDDMIDFSDFAILGLHWDR
jgi:hypothetical protein